MVSPTVVRVAARDGRHLALHILGDEPRILLVHGATATASTWKRLMPELAAVGKSSAAIDLRGHGHSSGAEELQKFVIDDYVEDVVHALNAFPSIETLVGHSMGGLVSQLAASQSNLSSLVLVASSPVNGMRKDGVRMACKHPWTFLRAGLTNSFRSLYRSRRVTRSLLFHQKSDDQLVTDFMNECQEESWRAGNQMKTYLPNPSLVKCTVRIIAGSDDFMVCRKSSSDTANAYGTELKVLEGCGHMVPYEADQKTLASLIVNDA
jgi:pimeloyl-ACP methyl ester carboxylesterase